MVGPKTINEGVGLMNAVLKNPPTFDAKMLALWSTLFLDWTEEQFLRASLQAARTLTFFPTPGELRALESGNVEASITEAWELTREAIRHHGWQASFCLKDFAGNGHALWALSKLGAERVGMMTNENRAIVAAEFRRLYTAAKAGGYTLDYLPGQYESRNLALGHSTDKPALLGRSSSEPVDRPSLEYSTDSLVPLLPDKRM